MSKYVPPVGFLFNYKVRLLSVTYKKSSKINAKFYVCSIASTGFTIMNTAIPGWKVKNWMFTFLAITSNKFRCTNQELIKSF